MVLWARKLRMKKALDILFRGSFLTNFVVFGRFNTKK
jgi:hypothetical protein